MSRWMDSVDRAMEREFGDFYDDFYGHTQQEAIDHKEEKPQKEEKKDKEEKPQKEEKPKKETKPEKEEKKDNEEKTKEEKEQPKPKESEEQPKSDEEDEPNYYSFSSSMYTGSDGVQHIFREEHDSKTGNHKIVETRRIGDKSMTLHRVTDKNGNVQEHETRKNINNDEELEQFKKDWIARNVPETSKLPAPKKDEPKAVKHEK